MTAQGGDHVAGAPSTDPLTALAAMDLTPERSILCENEWLSLYLVRKPAAGVNGYVYSHETRCGGRIVAVLPYADTPEGRRYLVKSEMTPCWSFDQVLSAITGGYEGGDIEDDAVREMLEETGYTIGREELIPLGWSYASKSADTVYSLFSVDLTGREPGEAIGDGSRVEAESKAVWLAADELANIADPQVSVMYLRLDGKG
jgi:8-oxo-dGTP pyrophosphatase MutT (NUDIX family)